MTKLVRALKWLIGFRPMTPAESETYLRQVH